MPYGIGTVVTLLIDIALTAHVVRTGRSYLWMLPILLFPPLGWIAYGAFVLLAEAVTSPGARRFADDVVNTVDPGRAYREKLRDVERVGSVDSKRALAAECIKRGRFQDAAVGDNQRAPRFREFSSKTSYGDQEGLTLQAKKTQCFRNFPACSERCDSSLFRQLDDLVVEGLPGVHRRKGFIDLGALEDKRIHRFARSLFGARYKKIILGRQQCTGLARQFHPCRAQPFPITPLGVSKHLNVFHICPSSGLPRGFRP